MNTSQNILISVPPAGPRVGLHKVALDQEIVSLNQSHPLGPTNTGCGDKFYGRGASQFGIECEDGSAGSGFLHFCKVELEYEVKDK